MRQVARLPRFHGDRYWCRFWALGLATWPLPGPWQFSQPTCFRFGRLLLVDVAGLVLEADGVAPHALGVEVPQARPLRDLLQRVERVAVRRLRPGRVFGRVARLARVGADVGQVGHRLGDLRRVRLARHVLEERVAIRVLASRTVLEYFSSSGRTTFFLAVTSAPGVT